MNIHCSFVFVELLIQTFVLVMYHMFQDTDRIFILDKNISDMTAKLTEITRDKDDAINQVTAIQKDLEKKVIVEDFSYRS